MPEYIKALIVVVGIAALVFSLAARHLAGAIIARSDYYRRVAVWFVVSAVAFVAHDYWVFAVLAGALLAIGGAKDSNPMAFYGALLCAVPPLGSSVSGLGVVNYFFDLDYLRLLSLVILLPAACRLFAARKNRMPGPKIPDALLVSYLALIFILTVLWAPFTTALRQLFYLFIDVWLVYYVASRSVRDMESLRDVVAAFVLGSLVMAVIAIFEATRGWLLYSTLESSLGVRWGYGAYMGRGLDGPLRAMASTGHPIVMGFLMVVAIPFLIFLKSSIRSTFIWCFTLSMLLGGLVVTLSRGPWVGGAAMALVAVMLGKGAAKRFGLLVTGMVSAAALALLSGWGRNLFEYLPFIGTIGSESVEYRQRLFDVSMGIVLQSPLFGAPDFYGRAAAQELRAGAEGIIDMVNSYMGIALGSGFVGLGLFIGLFASAITLAWRTSRAGEWAPSATALGQTLLAAITGILVTIATTSSINVIQPIYFMVIGLTVGCCGSFLAQVASANAGEFDPKVTVTPWPLASRLGMKER